MVASYKTGSLDEDVVSKASCNVHLISWLRQQLLETCNTEKRSLRVVLFVLLGHDRLVSRYTATLGFKIDMKREEIVQVENKLLRSLQGRSELDMKSYMRCSRVCQYRFSIDRTLR